MNLLWMLDGNIPDQNPPAETPAPAGPGYGANDFTALWTNTLQPLVTTLLYILAGALLVVLLIKGITTAMAVVKAADEPQVRQEKLNAFKYMAIGLGIAIVVLTVSATVLTLAGNNITGQETPSTFLF